jgi:hypothetical protein
MPSRNCWARNTTSSVTRTCRARVFKLLWDTIQAKNECNAYVKNMAKDGSFYWVFANVTPNLDP